MNKAAILKITGLILVPFLVMLIATFFLYPYLNEEKYEQIVEDNKSDFGIPIEDTDLALDTTSAFAYEPPEFDDDTVLAITDNSAQDDNEIQPYNSGEENDVVIIDSLPLAELNYLKNENTGLKDKVDSLMTTLDSLKVRVQVADSMRLAEANQQQEADEVASEEMTEEEFSQRVKSLLNLEEDELAPILAKMTTKQLVRLYKGGGTLQREKILRSLNSDRAAKLMTEIML
ncbi:MAG: hypothetical protein FH748_00800 [Balneolaceae bacterium]|nr:hypothetical protein [Balneolaceae bacterium]